MAISRLRNPVLSRAVPSLFRARFLSSYASPRPLSRTSNMERPFKDWNGSCLRPNALSSMVGIAVSKVLTEFLPKVTLQNGRRKEIRFLAKILVPDGSKDEPVGQPIAVMLPCKDTGS